MLAIIFLLLTSGANAESLPENFFKKSEIKSKWIRKVDMCSRVKSDKMVYLVKQWHLAPDVDTTKLKSAKKLPQFKNQSEIYSAVSQLIGENEIDTTIAEGCEGEMDSKFKESFNGWDLEKISKEKGEKNFNMILTHVLLKAEARHGEAVKTICGDDRSQIKYAQLALSDLRGSVGYLKRIMENERNPSKQKIYMDGVIEMLKLPSNSDAGAVLGALKKDLVSSLKKFNDANSERDAALVRAIKNSDSKKPILVVYGGLHAEDLKNKFQAEKWNCEIYEPKSYKNNEEKLLDEFKKAIQ